MRTAFKIFDTNGNGKISKKELTNVLVPGELATPDEVTTLLKSFDTSSDGKLSGEEVKRHAPLDRYP